jgi:hypothetical protein
LFPEAKLSNLDINEQPQYLAMKVAFFNLLWDEVFFPVFNRLGKPIPYASNLEEIFEATDSIDRYWEFKSILQRALLKLTKDVPILKKPKFSLNLISIALKANKWRLELEKKEKKDSIQSSIDKFNKFASLKAKSGYASRYKQNYQNYHGTIK